ncbi:MAG: hypothetical protein AB1705_18180 [Verrucomicrobiota bacterium]
MTAQVPFTLRGRNPDVLTCIANLSNDEVFTPPEFANRMLDTLAEAWAANHANTRNLKQLTTEISCERARICVEALKS